jgi:hypothetical protein
MKPLERRVNALKQLLKLERPTTKAKAYSEWETPPQVILEDDEARDLYNKDEKQDEEPV